MKSPNEDQGLDQSSNQTQTEETVDTGAISEPQQEQQHASEPEPEPGPGPESKQSSPQSCPRTLALVKSRIQQLQNRRFLLLQMQHFQKKREDQSSETTEDKLREGGDEECELEAIQKELEELLVRKKELENRGVGFNSTAERGHRGAVCPISYKIETPTGGIYTLPPPQLADEDASVEQTERAQPAVAATTSASSSEGQDAPVITLGGVSTVTQCPFCKEVISTEIHSTVGETMWLLCCLCSMMGCIGGCCLIPFCMDQMKNIHHECPRCQSHIGTHQPL